MKFRLNPALALAWASGLEYFANDKARPPGWRKMAELFAVDVRTIGEYLKNVFASGELGEESAIRKFRNTAADGKSYLTQFNNLDANISVGYRVNSLRATQFRQWATHILREFAIKGYVLDKKRMENGAFLGEDFGAG
ncbi:MAG: RhuM family protein [Sulfuritalea sp.]|nr:RhuM family protein [Sulfuritalea sp.]